MTTQILAGGRFLLGLGAGYERSEFEQAGLRYPPTSARLRRLAALARTMPRLAAGETIDDEELGLHQASVGLPPTDLPVLVGGNGDGVLRVAARYARAVSLVGFTMGTGETDTNLSHWSWEGLRNRIEVVRHAARDRGLPEIHILVQFASVTNEPADAVARWLGEEPPDGYLDTPFLLVGDEEQMGAHIARLAQLGVTSISVFEDSADAVVPFIHRAS